jgi:hypothetical protein
MVGRSYRGRNPSFERRAGRHPTIHGFSLSISTDAVRIEGERRETLNHLLKEVPCASIAKQASPVITTPALSGEVL